MRRKVVKQGAATLMVSLPSKWAKSVNLKKGDEIDIEESNGNLIIAKEKVQVKKQASVNLASYSESAIRVAIWNPYRAGYDRIVVHFKDDKQYKIVKDVVHSYLIGFDVIKKEKDSCVLENITEPSEEQFDVILRKILYNISMLIEITENRLKNRPVDEDYNDIVLKIHQYDNFCRRVISKKHVSGTEAGLYWSFLTLLVHGQRELYHLNRFLDENTVRFRNFEFFSYVKKVFELLMAGFMQKDLASLERIHEMQKNIYSDFYQSIQKGQKESVVIYHLVSANRNFYFSASPLIGLLLSSSTSV